MYTQTVDSTASPRDGRIDRYLRAAEEDELAIRSLRARARLDSVTWMAGLATWDIYATLTYDPKRATTVCTDSPVEIRAPSLAASQRHVRKWVADSQLAVGRVASSVAAIEHTKAGWPHAHLLLGMGGIDSYEFTQLSELWFARHGFCRFDRLDAADALPVAAYLTKYFTKADSELLLIGPLDSSTGTGRRRLGLRTPRVRSR